MWTFGWNSTPVQVLMCGIVRARDLRVGRYPATAQVDLKIGRFEKLFRCIRFLFVTSWYTTTCSHALTNVVGPNLMRSGLILATSSPFGIARLSQRPLTKNSTGQLYWVFSFYGHSTSSGFGYFTELYIYKRYKQANKRKSTLPKKCLTHLQLKSSSNGPRDQLWNLCLGKISLSLVTTRTGRSLNKVRSIILISLATNSRHKFPRKWSMGWGKLALRRQGAEGLSHEQPIGAVFVHV